jgi:hypothetical protein
MILIGVFEKGKPFESVGRKAAGLNPRCLGYGSRAAEQMQHLLVRCVWGGETPEMLACYHMSIKDSRLFHAVSLLFTS